MKDGDASGIAGVADNHCMKRVTAARRAPFPPHAFAGFFALPGVAPRAILGYNNRRRRAVYR